MADFVKVASLSEIPDGIVKGVKAGSEQIALYNLGGEIFATSDICTHEMCVISENNEINKADGVVECTCHGSQYNIKTGENVQPPSAEPLKTYQVKVEGDDVLVEV